MKQIIWILVLFYACSNVDKSSSKQNTTIIKDSTGDINKDVNFEYQNFIKKIKPIKLPILDLYNDYNTNIDTTGFYPLDGSFEKGFFLSDEEVKKYLPIELSKDSLKKRNKIDWQTVEYIHRNSIASHEKYDIIFYSVDNGEIFRAGLLWTFLQTMSKNGEIIDKLRVSGIEYEDIFWEYKMTDFSNIEVWTKKIVGDSAKLVSKNFYKIDIDGHIIPR